MEGVPFLLRVLPYRSRDLVDGVVLTLIDISARKRTEDQLRRMSKVFMDGADPIIIEDLEGRIKRKLASHDESTGHVASADPLLGSIINERFEIVS